MTFWEKIKEGTEMLAIGVFAVLFVLSVTVLPFVLCVFALAGALKWLFA